MKKEKEKCIVFCRYMLLAVVVGVLAGALDAVFGRGLLWITDFRTAHVRTLLPFLPLAGLLITWLYHHFDEESLKGMTLIFETGQRKRESIPLLLIPLVLFGTWITHLFGGSAGREGVAVQMGAALSHEIGRKLHVSSKDRVMLIVGMAAGFGGLFQTPLAAVFFALEVIVAGCVAYEALLPAMVASYMAAFTSHALGLEKFSVPLHETLALSTPGQIGQVILLGAAFGLTGLVFSGLLQKTKAWMAKVLPNPYRRIGLVSVALAAILFLGLGGRYCGLGTNLIQAAFAGDKVYSFDWILKLLLTVLTLSIGFQGGEVTPLFSIGATLGVLLGSILGLPVELCAALGYAAVFGSATNTLLAPIFIGIEVFGAANAVPFTIVCVIAYALNRNRSIYTAQILHRNPS